MSFSYIVYNAFDLNIFLLGEKIIIYMIEIATIM